MYLIHFMKQDLGRIGALNQAIYFTLIPLKAIQNDSFKSSKKLNWSA